VGWYPGAGIPFSGSMISIISGNNIQVVLLLVFRGLWCGSFNDFV